MAGLLSEVTGTSISGWGTPFAACSRLDWLQNSQVNARLSGLERSDFVVCPACSIAWG